MRNFLFLDDFSEKGIRDKRGGWKNVSNLNKRGGWNKHVLSGFFLKN